MNISPISSFPTGKLLKSPQAYPPSSYFYGRNVRGPLDVLKEVWSGEEIEKTTVAAHLIQMRGRLEEMSDLTSRELRQSRSGRMTRGCKYSHWK